MQKSWLLAIAVSIAGCASGDDAVGTDGTATEPTVVFGPKRFALQGAGKGGLGADCQTGAGRDCLSGLCLRTPDASAGIRYFCSEPCGNGPNQRCAAGYRCTSIAPHPQSSFCFPEPAGPRSPPTPATANYWVAPNAEPTDGGAQ